jgi:hypothetical protein
VLVVIDMDWGNLMMQEFCFQAIPSGSLAYPDDGRSHTSVIHHALPYAHNDVLIV